MVTFALPCRAGPLPRACGGPPQRAAASAAKYRVGQADDVADLLKLLPDTPPAASADDWLSLDRLLSHDPVAKLPKRRPERQWGALMEADRNSVRRDERLVRSSVESAETSAWRLLSTVLSASGARAGLPTSQRLRLQTRVVVDQEARRRTGLVREQLQHRLARQAEAADGRTKATQSAPKVSLAELLGGSRAPASAAERLLLDVENSEAAHRRHLSNEAGAGWAAINRRGGTGFAAARAAMAQREAHAAADRAAAEREEGGCRSSVQDVERSRRTEVVLYAAIDGRRLLSRQRQWFECTERRQRSGIESAACGLSDLAAEELCERQAVEELLAAADLRRREGEIMREAVGKRHSAAAAEVARQEVDCRSALLLEGGRRWERCLSALRASLILLQSQKRSAVAAAEAEAFERVEGAAPRVESQRPQLSGALTCAGLLQAEEAARRQELCVARASERAVLLRQRSEHAADLLASATAPRPVRSPPDPAPVFPRAAGSPPRPRAPGPSAIARRRVLVAEAEGRAAAAEREAEERSAVRVRAYEAVVSLLDRARSAGRPPALHHRPAAASPAGAALRKVQQREAAKRAEIAAEAAVGAAGFTACPREAKRRTAERGFAAVEIQRAARGRIARVAVARVRGQREASLEVRRLNEAAVSIQASARGRAARRATAARLSGEAEKAGADPLAAAEGVWRDGRGHLWTAAGGQVREQDGRGRGHEANTLHARDGQLELLGVRSQHLTRWRVVWADGDVWTRVAGGRRQA